MKNMKKQKQIKKRDPMAFDLLTNGLYKPKVMQNKKAYNRKKLKKGRELIKTPYYLYTYCNAKTFIFSTLLLHPFP